jgi:hypothetical protein
MGAALTMTQFYVYGKRRFTKTGFEIAQKKYKVPTQPPTTIATSVIIITTILPPPFSLLPPLAPS